MKTRINDNKINILCLIIQMKAKVESLSKENENEFMT